MMVRRSTSGGMRRRELPRREKRLMRLIADRLSVNHRKEQRWRAPQSLDTEVRKIRTEAHPPSSLRVELSESRGPSTGPDPRYKISFPVLYTVHLIAFSTVFIRYQNEFLFLQIFEDL